MSLVSLFILPIVLLFTSWGIGALMASVGKIRRWNTKGAFWISAILYALLLSANSIAVATLGAPNSNIVNILFFILLGIGILSPFINLAIKWVFPDVFSKSSNRTNVNTDYQETVEKKPSMQKQSTSPGDERQYKPEPVKPTSDLKGYNPRTGFISGQIFMSYRRSDSADIAGRIYDRLIAKFGRDAVFKDVDSIPLGLDFKEYLDEKVGECNVLLVIIGDRWLKARGSSGQNRLDDPSDFVRIEIESALQRNIPVIPLLVRDAQMPREDMLPSSLQKLVYRNGTPIRPDPDFHRDMDRLISALEKYIR